MDSKVPTVQQIQEILRTATGGFRGVKPSWLQSRRYLKGWRLFAGVGISEQDVKIEHAYRGITFD
jgi:hypothetical protein